MTQIVAQATQPAVVQFSSAEFTAKASAVTEAETATLTAQAGRVSESYALRLGAAVPELKLATTSVSFGDVAVKTAASKTVKRLNKQLYARPA